MHQWTNLIFDTNSSGSQPLGILCKIWFQVCSHSSLPCEAKLGEAGPSLVISRVDRSKDRRTCIPAPGTCKGLWAAVTCSVFVFLSRWSDEVLYFPFWFSDQWRQSAKVSEANGCRTSNRDTFLSLMWEQQPSDLHPNLRKDSVGETSCISRFFIIQKLVWFPRYSRLISSWTVFDSNSRIIFEALFDFKINSVPGIECFNLL